MAALPKTIQNAIVSGPIPKTRNWRKRHSEAKSLTAAERVMAFAETYLKVPEGKLTGEPIKLELFQEAFFYAVFDNYVLTGYHTRIAILSMGRKNSKTVTSAMILLAYICGPFAKENKNNMLCSGAMGREQAALVFKHMCAFINASEQLQEVCRIVPSGKRIVGLKHNVEYQALAKEGSTTVGRSDKVILGDEWGQIKGPTDAFVDALLTSQGAHENPLVIMISTQSADDGDYLSTVIDDSTNTADPTVVCHLYCAPKDADVLDKKA